MARYDGGDAGEQTGHVLLVARALRHLLPTRLEAPGRLSQSHRLFSLPQTSKFNQIDDAPVAMEKRSRKALTADCTLQLWRAWILLSLSVPGGSLFQVPKLSIFTI